MVDTISAVNLTAMRPTWEDLSRSDLLSTAQERALKVMKDAHKKLKEYRAELKQRKRGTKGRSEDAFRTDGQR